MNATEWVTAVGGGAAVGAVCTMLTKIVRMVYTDRQHKREVELRYAALITGRNLPKLPPREKDG